VARSKIPEPLARRHLLERDLAPAAALRIAEAYLAVGRTLEAVDFLGIAGEGEKLAELRREAVRTGDAFALRSLATATGEAASREEWVALAEAAAAAGKDRYAEQARRQARRGEE
jgi:hypothetical protein